MTGKAATRTEVGRGWKGADMLVLSRKHGQRILIGDDIVITVVAISTDNKVRIGIDAPRDVLILREEVPRELPGGAK